MTTLEGVAALLEEAGLGAFDRDIFATALPDEPDEAVGLREYPGAAPEYYHNDPAPQHESPRVQVVVRGLLYPPTRARADAIMLALGSVHNRALGGVTWEAVRPLSQPFDMPLDDQRRRRYVACSYEVRKGLG